MTVLISGGCIRLYPASHATPGPRWHINPEHSTIGLIDTSTQPTIDSDGWIEIKLINAETDTPNGPVVSMTAAADESLAGLGVTAGCSNGGEIVRIRLVKVGTNGQPAPLDLNDPIHWSRVAGSTNNIWLTLVHDVL